MVSTTVARPETGSSQRVEDEKQADSWHTLCGKPYADPLQITRNHTGMKLTNVYTKYLLPPGFGPH